MDQRQCTGINATLRKPKMPSCKFDWSRKKASQSAGNGIAHWKHFILRTKGIPWDEACYSKLTVREFQLRGLNLEERPITLELSWQMLWLRPNHIEEHFRQATVDWFSAGKGYRLRPLCSFHRLQVQVR